MTQNYVSIPLSAVTKYPVKAPSGRALFTSEFEGGESMAVKAGLTVVSGVGGRWSRESMNWR